MSVLPHILRYRELVQACDKGDDLGMDEVLSMEQLGSLLRRQAEASAGPTITAILTSGTDEHCVEITALGPDQVTCADAPRILPGTTLGLRLDESSENSSYLFKVAVTASEYSTTTERWTLQLALVGCPVVLSWGWGRPPSSDAVLKLERSLKAA